MCIEGLPLQYDLGEFTVLPCTTDVPLLQWEESSLGISLASQYCPGWLPPLQGALPMALLSPQGSWSSAWLLHALSSFPKELPSPARKAWGGHHAKSSDCSTCHLAAGSPVLALAPDYLERDLGTGLLVCPWN